MAKIKKLKKIGIFLKKHWKKWTILAILFIIAFVGFIVYEHVYKPLYQSMEVEAQKLEIKKKTYRDVMDSYYEREDKIDEIVNKLYPNPFK